MGRLNEHIELFNKIKEYDNFVWVEIGVRFGKNANLILTNFEVDKIYLIDPYCELPYLPNFFNSEAVKENFKIATQKLEPFKDKCIWMKDFSYNVYDEIPDNSVDILYIDGDHSYETVLLDLNNYYSKVKSGGLIIGDDYNEPDVKEAIIDFTLENDIEYNVSKVGLFSSKFWFIK